LHYPLSLFIGLRYTRAKRRNHFISFISFISTFGIALGVIVLITVLSVMNGFQKEVRERILGMTSHADIQSANGGMVKWQEALAKAQTHPKVVAAAPYINGQAMLTNRSQVSGVLYRGIDPEMEKGVVDVSEHMYSGKYGSLESGKFNIIIGRELARVLDVDLGSKIALLIPKTNMTPMGTMPRMKRFTVSGIFEVGMGEYDRGIALIHIKDAAKLQRMKDKVSGIKLKLVDLFDAQEVSYELARSFSGLYRVLSWSDQHRNFFSALQMEKRMMGLLLFFIIIIAAFNIVATLVMVVIDKQSDIAILKTLGAAPRLILNIFMVQGTFIGLTGTLVGVFLGVILSLNLESVVGFIENAFSIQFIDPNIYYIAKLPSDLQSSDVLMVAVGSLLCSFLMTLYPAIHAYKTNPAEALSYE